MSRTVDVRSGYRTKSVLCAPIYSGIRNKVIGVVQMINKIGVSEIFGADDEQVCQLMAIVQCELTVLSV